MKARSCSVCKASLTREQGEQYKNDMMRPFFSNIQRFHGFDRFAGFDDFDGFDSFEGFHGFDAQPVPSHDLDTTSDATTEGKANLQGSGTENIGNHEGNKLLRMQGILGQGNDVNKIKNDIMQAGRERCTTFVSAWSRI